MGDKILLCTVYNKNNQNLYDYWTANSRRNFFRFSLPRPCSFGLRFLKQNLPDIEIIEFPTWEEYKQKIMEKKWDVVGFSFYLNEIHEILEMVKFARTQGIKEIWAGNYGALTDGMEKYFDKVFFGYAENQVAQYLGKTIQPNDIIHPPLIGPCTTSFNIKVNCVGYLFTNRGCNHRCDFCQTPPFCNKPYRLSIEHIENVLQYYHNLGITQLIILDESFGLFKKHSETLIDLFQKYGFYWFPMVRADTIKNRLNEWINKGLAGALIGIESLNQDRLNTMGKNLQKEQIIEIIKKLRKRNRMTVGFYMIGFEHDTVESLKKDLQIVAKLRMDITQLCVVTPLPKTPLWDQIEKKYGIFDKDWHHYNAKHLVWNHPHISPKEMQEVLHWGFNLVYPRVRPFETAKSYIFRYLQDKGAMNGLLYTVRHFYHANMFNYYPKNRYFLKPNGSIENKNNGKSKSYSDKQQIPMS